MVCINHETLLFTLWHYRRLDPSRGEDELGGDQCAWEDHSVLRSLSLNADCLLSGTLTEEASELEE